MTDIQRAAAALLILSAIPVVTLALWAGYYHGDFERRRRQEAEFDPANELSKIRTIGMCAMFFQFALYLGASEVRSAYPWLAPVGCGLAFMAQAAIQAGIEKRIRAKAIPPVRQLKAALRFLSTLLVAGAFYSVTLASCVLAASLIGALAGLSGSALSALVMAGGVLGLAGGIGVNFALGAFHVRRLFPVAPLEDELLIKKFKTCFMRAGVRAPRFWIIEMDRFKYASALIAGFRNGRGLFAPGLFISRTALNQLTDDELESVVLHEVSHLSLNHLRSRLLFSSGLILATTIAGTFFVLLGHLMMPREAATWILGPAAGFLAFVVTFKLLGDQSQFHELEADIHSIEKLGGQLADLSAALRKLDRINRRSPHVESALDGGGGPLAPAGHPETERRILMIRHYLATKAKLAAAKQAEKASQRRKDAA